MSQHTFTSGWEHDGTGHRMKTTCVEHPNTNAFWSWDWPDQAALKQWTKKHEEELKAQEPVTGE